MAPTRSTVLALAAAALVAGGCGIEDPYAEPEPEASAASPVPSAEQAATVPAREEPKGERELLVRFAEAWLDSTIRARPSARRELTALSTGRLRETIMAETRGDSPSGDGSLTRGTLEGILPRAPGQVLVITRETTRFEAGGRQSGYAIYLARTDRIDGAWRVVQWQPTL